MTPFNFFSLTWRIVRVCKTMEKEFPGTTGNFKKAVAMQRLSKKASTIKAVSADISKLIDVVCDLGIQNG